MKKTKICIALPWYNGPDPQAYQLFFELFHYMGRLQERSKWFNAANYQGKVWPLDPMEADGGRAEITPEDGIFEFGLTDEAGLSLPGLARERCVDNALKWGADYIFMFDDDMQFPWSTLIRLWRHQKPVVAALAFTARRPIQPVIYRIVEKPDPVNKVMTYNSEVVYDYPKDQLISNAEVGGSLAFGAGVMLLHTDIFRQMPKPWFQSTGCGEDFFFCYRCQANGIPRYVDTSLKTMHKAAVSEWVDEGTYWTDREKYQDIYAKLIADQKG